MDQAVPGLGRGAHSAAAAVARLLDRPALRRLVELAREAAGDGPATTREDPPSGAPTPHRT